MPAHGTQPVLAGKFVVINTCAGEARLRIEAGFIATVVKGLVPLLIIVSPDGTLPLFLSMTVDDGPIRRRRSAWYTAVTRGAVLALAAHGGKMVFRFFGITLDAFRIAGGALMFLYAIDMVQMRTPRMKTTQEEVAGGVAQQKSASSRWACRCSPGPGRSPR